jgi:hypothetical protein
MGSDHDSSSTRNTGGISTTGSDHDSSSNYCDVVVNPPDEFGVCEFTVVPTNSGTSGRLRPTPTPRYVVSNFLLEGAPVQLQPLALPKDPSIEVVKNDPVPADVQQHMVIRSIKTTNTRSKNTSAGRPSNFARPPSHTLPKRGIIKTRGISNKKRDTKNENGAVRVKNTRWRKGKEL